MDSLDGKTSDASLYLVPYGDDVTATLANIIIGQNRAILPDLSRTTILLPDLQAAPRLRLQLLELAKRHDIGALIGPNIYVFREWVISHSASSPRPRLTPQQRELMLTEVLMRHPSLYGKGSPWALAQSLLELFDELTLHQASPPADYAEFVRLLSSGYRAGKDVRLHLGREAELVYTLWHTWHQQLEKEGTIEPATAHLLALTENQVAESETDQLFLAGFHHFSSAELQWLKRLLKRRQVTLLLQGEPPATTHEGTEKGESSESAIDRLIRNLAEKPVFLDSSRSRERPLGRFLHSVYHRNGHTLRDRARRFAAQHPRSPAKGHLFLFAAGNSDEEARAIDIQVRRWLLAGHRQIGIVTENRRLARQVRALLEQGGVTIDDRAGWALSTTRAAASLECWLEAIEEDFHHRPLLDLLKSPFVFADMERTHVDTVVHRFEQDIVHTGNIARGMSRYLQYLTWRDRHLPEWAVRHGAKIRELLTKVDRAAAPLLPCLRETHFPTEFMDALLHSLETLGMRAALQEDEAGIHVLQQLEYLAQAAHDSRLEMDWREFRTWLGTNLERSHFRPPASNNRVQLMNLSQSTMGQFDALVIASVEREFLPGADTRSPFFNDGVRQELGLPTHVERLTERFHLFRRLLQAAPEVLLTFRREQDGEIVPASPWLDRLRTFHRVAYGDDLDDGDLPRLIHHPRTKPFRCDTHELPDVARAPAPSIPSATTVSRMSAGAYQQLLDCPYQFFAARCLRLTAPEPLREALAKSDFGERVHRCLEAFHSNLPELPGPFLPPFDEQRQSEAVALLEEIAERVFAEDLESSFLHRSWLQQWKRLIPYYVEWQFRRAEDYQVKKVELELSREIILQDHPVVLHGRIDRLDEGEHGTAIVDYKTGFVARREEIVAGESVQLPFYALLLENKVERCEYLQLANRKVGSQAVLEGETLKNLVEHIDLRLRRLVKAIRDGSPLPAWGDESTCARCPFSGICRRQTWEKTEQGWS